MPFCIIDLSICHSHEERLFTPGKYLVHLWKIIMTSGDDCRAYRNRRKRCEKLLGDSQRCEKEKGFITELCIREFKTT